MFSAVAHENDDDLRASYNIALIIAKTGKAHTIGKTLNTFVIREVMTTILKKDQELVLRAIPLSNSTEQKRIDKMASNTERNLCNHLQNMNFSLQLDESNLSRNKSELSSYAQFIHKSKIHLELIFAHSMETDNEEQMPTKNTFACTTDGAAAVAGRYGHFVALLM